MGSVQRMRDNIERDQRRVRRDSPDAPSHEASAPHDHTPIPMASLEEEEDETPAAIPPMLEMRGATPSTLHGDPSPSSTPQPFPSLETIGNEVPVFGDDNVNTTDPTTTHAQIRDALNLLDFHDTYDVVEVEVDLGASSDQPRWDNVLVEAIQFLEDTAFVEDPTYSPGTPTIEFGRRSNDAPLEDTPTVPEYQEAYAGRGARAGAALRALGAPTPRQNVSTTPGPRPRLGNRVHTLMDLLRESYEPERDPSPLRNVPQSGEPTDATPLRFNRINRRRPSSPHRNVPQSTPAGATPLQFRRINSHTGSGDPPSPGRRVPNEFRGDVRHALMQAAPFLPDWPVVQHVANHTLRRRLHKRRMRRGLGPVSIQMLAYS